MKKKCRISTKKRLSLLSLTCLLAEKNRRTRNQSAVDRIARRPTINVGNFTTTFLTPKAAPRNCYDTKHTCEVNERQGFVHRQTGKSSFYENLHRTTKLYGVYLAVIVHFSQDILLEETHNLRPAK